MPFLEGEPSVGSYAYHKASPCSVVRICIGFCSWRRKVVGSL